MSSPELLSLKIVRRRDIAERVVALDLAAPDGAPLPAFTAGAHLDVHVAPGVTRCYSLWGDPADSRLYRIAVLLEPSGRGGSKAVHGGLPEGGAVTVGLPRNAFPLDEGAPHTLLLAGGIGITPLLAMAARLTAIGRPFALHAFFRSAAAAPLRDEAEQLAGTRLHVHLDDEPSSRLDLAALAAAQPPGTHAYVCGPRGFMEAAVAALRMRLPEGAIHTESFSPPEAEAGDRPFICDLARSGRSIPVPADRSLLSVLIESGLPMDWSCEQGLCGVCVTPVLGGVPDHRDHYLSPAERVGNTLMTPCCSRALTDRLVLDL
ncbi:PDR/VanB family oxidoreductase [Segnochrobactrum spirostomi]|uniref:Oxidoreductase n=1 Tax=Segnochrobactrum spirostomi TaxID=2608987 RepID=A0A6A7Y7H4_9HYPH|nr:PDR/VanB family oxidoreductase [Segnochrobactrum spirostomi]MQT15310.1 oxidoreductase [Segnochrobactrum spirostomi]